jgi:hypothetical protein
MFRKSSCRLAPFSSCVAVADRQRAVDGDAASPFPIALVIGLPAGLRARLEQQFRDRVMIQSIFLKQDGGFQLQPPPGVAIRLIEQVADKASSQGRSYEHLLVVVLPYASIPEKVLETVSALASLGASILVPKPGNQPWPSRSPRLDQKFQTELLGALLQVIDQAFPEPKDADNFDEVAFELLRGLASHSKMGPNNHSHEDDLWKSRGRNLRPGGKERILKSLLAAGLLGRKQNDSAGGKGWVYWIADVNQAKNRYPALAQYLV